jgi:hypothetical protein
MLFSSAVVDGGFFSHASDLEITRAILCKEALKQLIDGIELGK